MNSPFFTSHCFAWLVVSLQVSFSPNVIGLNAIVTIGFDGESTDEHPLNANLFDQLPNQFPSRLLVSHFDGVEPIDQDGTTICQLGTLPLDRKNSQLNETIRSDCEGLAMSGDLILKLDVIGARPREIDPIRIGRVSC
jgi:hypothetical protein